MYFKLISGLLIFLLLLTHKANSQPVCDCPLLPGISEALGNENTQNFGADKIVPLQKSGNIICEALALEFLAYNLYNNYTGYDSARYYLNKAEELYKKSGCGDEVYIELNTKWFCFYQYQGNYKTALEYLMKNLPITEKAKKHFEHAYCLLDISSVFCETSQPIKGIEYCRQAMPEIEMVEDLYNRAQLCFNVANRYLYYYDTVKDKKCLDTASLYANMAVSIGKKSGNKIAINSGFHLLGEIANYLGNYKDAIRYTDSSLLLSRIQDEKYMIAGAFESLAYYQMDAGNLNEARRMIDSCLYYEKICNRPESIAGMYHLLTQIEEQAGNYKAVVDAMRNEKIIRDSLGSSENTRALNELEQKYNKVKNENTIKDLDQKKQLYFFLAIVGLLAAAAIGFFMRQQTLKHKKNILETEQRLNRARMNPHFFFNALTSLQKFALKENDGQAMASNLSKFSNIMRETLESTYKEYVTIEQEMEFLTEYLEVQQIRFPQAFSYEVSAADNLEIDELQIPAMIIQPFVENSIEHGFAGVDYPGNISVKFASENKALLIEITDNGKGLNTTAKETLSAGQAGNEHISRASQIIKDRIYLLNIKLKTKAGFSIDNNSTGNGVIVKIHLPLLFKDQSATTQLK